MTAEPRDMEHLRLLSIAHFVLGGLVALFALFAIAYLLFGSLAMVSHNTTADNPLPILAGGIFIFVGIAFLCVGTALAVGLILSGRFLAQRRNYWYCMIVAGLCCLFTPFGTVLGIMTILVLNRPSVKALFVA